MWYRDNLFRSSTRITANFHNLHFGKTISWLLAGQINSLNFSPWFSRSVETLITGCSMFWYCAIECLFIWNMTWLCILIQIIIICFAEKLSPLVKRKWVADVLIPECHVLRKITWCWSSLKRLSILKRKRIEIISTSWHKVNRLRI